MQLFSLPKSVDNELPEPTLLPESTHPLTHSYYYPATVTNHPLFQKKSISSHCTLHLYGSFEVDDSLGSHTAIYNIQRRES